MDQRQPGPSPSSGSSAFGNPETLLPETWEQIHKPFPIIGQSQSQAVKRFDRLRAVVVLLFVSVLGLLCGRCAYSAFTPAGMIGLEPSTATMPPKAASAGTATPWIVYRLVTPIPTATPLPTQTARVVYVTRVLTVTPAALALLAPPRSLDASTISREGGCWVLNLYGVNGVWVDGTPVAPAFGHVRVCGAELRIR